MKPLALAVAVALAWSAPVHGHSPQTRPTTGPSADVAALIVQLDADDPAARDAAVDRLVALGEPVDPAVADAAARSPSPEVRSRAAGVIARLKRVAADRPTVITLHLAKAKPTDVFAAIAKQAGVTIKLWPEEMWNGRFNAVPGVTVDLDAVPFWSAVDQVCKQVGGRPERMGDDADLTIMQGQGEAWLAGPQSTADRVTAVARQYTATRQIGYAKGDQQTTGSIGLLVLLDPKLKLVDGKQAEFHLTDATDDKGTSLIDPNNRDTQVGQPGGLYMDVALSLAPPAAGATKIATLTGEIQGEVSVATDQLVIDDLAHAGHVTRTAGPYTVELTSAEVTGRIVKYALTVTGGDGQTPQSTRGMKVQDADGHDIAGGGSTSANSDGTRLTVKAEVHSQARIKSPVRLVWPVATSTKPLRATFTFHDLPLPTP